MAEICDYERAMNERAIRINRLAQGLDSVDAGIEWFQSGAANEKQLILDTLAMCASQSHPRRSSLKLLKIT
jgi:hypothetical protein